MPTIIIIQHPTRHVFIAIGIFRGFRGGIENLEKKSISKYVIITRETRAPASPYCFYRRWWCARNRANTEHVDSISHQWHRKQFFKWLNVVVVRKSTNDFFLSLFSNTNWQLLVWYGQKTWHWLRSVEKEKKKPAALHTHTAIAERPQRTPLFVIISCGTTWDRREGARLNGVL